MEVLWLQDVYDRTWDIRVGYRRLGTRWSDNWLSTDQESFYIYSNSIHINIY
jgi:hypothetical protein